MPQLFESVLGEESDLIFKFNGQFALKNYDVKIVNGNRLRVTSVTDELFSLMEAEVSEVEINGRVYSDPKEAQEALQKLIYTHPTPSVITKEEILEVQQTLTEQSQITSGIGDASMDQSLLMFCGDSTTWQMTALGGGFDYMTTTLRKPGMPMAHVIGTLNFGSSGYSLKGFFEDALTPLPAFVSETENLGIGKWDFFGHTPQVKIPLNTALAFRKTRPGKVIWTICYGINDCILYAEVGNKTQQEITDYIYDYLVKSAEKIRSKYNDIIIWRMPNTMVARPFDPAKGFPSPKAYPDFGKDLDSDIALVDKWNTALRNAYLKIQGKYNNTMLLDTHEKVFGLSNPKISQAQLPFMTDLVHPSNSGYIGIVNEWVNLFQPSLFRNKVQRDRADKTSVISGTDPWSIFPEYFLDHPKYNKISEVRLSGAIGSNYADLGMSSGDFIKLTNNKPIYFVAPGICSQKFERYNMVETSPNTIRIIGIAPKVELQGYNGNLQIYTDTSDIIGRDEYLLTQISNLKPRFILWGKVSSAGNGYIDFGINETDQHLVSSTKFLKGLEKGQLIVGGNVKTNVSLIGTILYRSGVTSQRAFRISKSGDNSALANSVACIVLESNYALPTSYEGVAMVKKHVSVINAFYTLDTTLRRMFLHNPVKLWDGAKFYLRNSEVIPKEIKASLYKIANNNTRVLVGELTIPINVGKSNEITEPVIEEDHVYEVYISSSTSHDTGIITFIMEPL